MKFLSSLVANVVLPPWLAPFRHLLMPLAIVLAAWATYAWVTGRAYDRGYEASQLEVDKASAAFLARLTLANEAIAGEAARTNAAVDAALKERPVIVRTVKEIVDANPEFAAVRRPERLHAERVRQLDTIAAAAADRELR